ncbi:MAG: hypothetical protein UH241_06630 [Acutalibacteraceae bacterium]|nr:hypothetical protein [Acutalibacteraceae bacterium]
MPNKKENLLKNVIRACKGKYNVEELTIIDGHKILFSGQIEKFEAQCEASMILWRNELLKREVEDKNVFGVGGAKLFVFLTPKEKATSNGPGC